MGCFQVSTHLSVLPAIDFISLSKMLICFDEALNFTKHKAIL